MMQDRLAFFGLSREPFGLAADPRLIYPSQSFRQGFDQLLERVKRSHGGVMVVSGEVGTGKTTLTNCIIEALQDQIRCHRILDPTTSRQQVLESIGRLIGAPDATVEQIEIHAQACSRESSTVAGILIFEEAQNLSPDLLHLILVLSNIESEGRKLFVIVLCGQPELHALLARTEYRQLSQRILTQVRLTALGRAETADYIAHRLNLAGCSGAVFDRSAIQRIFQVTGGNPRLVNALSDESLSWLFAHGKKTLSAQAMKQVAEQAVASGRLSRSQVPPPRSLSRIALVAGCILMGLVGYGAFSKKVSLGDVMDPLSSWLHAGEVHMLAALDRVFDWRSRTPEVGQSIAVDPAPAQAELQVMKRWRDHGYALGNPPMCGYVNESGLACWVIDTPEFEAIFAMNRPFVLYGPQNTQMAILRRAGSQFISANGQLIDAMTWKRLDVMRVELLWKPPAQMAELTNLDVGIYQPESIRWLNRTLESVSAVDGAIITGGVFTSYHAHLIETFQQNEELPVTGRLDQQTLLRLNERLFDVPTLDRDVTAQE